jgi:hypothetical protein
MQFQHDPVFTSPVFAEPVVFHGQAIAMPLLPQAVMAFAVYPSQKNDGDSNGCAGDHVGYAVVRRYIPMGCDRLSKLQLPHCNRGRRFVFDDVTRAFSDNFELLSPAANTSPFTTASMALSPGSLDIVLKTDPLSGTSTLMLVAGLNDLTPSRGPWQHQRP